MSVLEQDHVILYHTHGYYQCLLQPNRTRCPGEFLLSNNIHKKSFYMYYNIIGQSGRLWTPKHLLEQTVITTCNSQGEMSGIMFTAQKQPNTTVAMLECSLVTNFLLISTSQGLIQSPHEHIFVQLLLSGYKTRNTSNAVVIRDRWCEGVCTHSQRCWQNYTCGCKLE